MLVNICHLLKNNRITQQSNMLFHAFPHEMLLVIFPINLKVSTECRFSLDIHHAMFLIVRKVVIKRVHIIWYDCLQFLEIFVLSCSNGKECSVFVSQFDGTWLDALW